MSVACREARWPIPASGRALFYRLWQPRHATAAIVIVHGFGEHGDRYRSMAEALAGLGLAVAVPDLPGHGLSGGRPGDFTRIDEYIDPLNRFTRDVVLPETGLARCALFGHSFGGLVAILWAVRHPGLVTRLIAQSPLLEIGFTIPRWKRAVARMCLALWPTAQFSMDLDLTNLSRDPAVIDAYRRDPLVHHLISARAYAATLRARAEAEARVGELQIPLLLLCGADDRIISVARAMDWGERVTVEKSCRTFPGMCHELHHEPVRDEVVRLVAEWAMGRPLEPSG